MLRIQAPVIMKVCSILEEQIREANQQLGGPKVKVCRYLTDGFYATIGRGADKHTARLHVRRGIVLRVSALCIKTEFRRRTDRDTLSWSPVSSSIHYPSSLSVDIQWFRMDVVAEGTALWAYNRLRSRIALHHHYGLESSGTENDAMFWLFRKVSSRQETLPNK